MPDLLAPKRRSRMRPYFEAVPSPSEPKAIFAETHRITCSPEFTANISRAVIQNIWHSERSTSSVDRDDFGAIVAKVFEDVRVMGNTPRPTAEAIQRAVRHKVARTILKALQEAQTKGKVEDVNASLEAWLTSVTRPPTEGFIDHAQRLDECGQTDAALDIIFDQIDEKLLAGNFIQVDQTLANTSPENLSIDLLLGILTATLPAKTHLKSRQLFYRQVQETLERRGRLKEGILVGLE
jgi:hypothetical protein